MFDGILEICFITVFLATVCTYRMDLVILRLNLCSRISLGFGEMKKLLLCSILFFPTENDILWNILTSIKPFLEHI